MASDPSEPGARPEPETVLGETPLPTPRPGFDFGKYTYVVHLQVGRTRALGRYLRHGAP